MKRYIPSRFSFALIICVLTCIFVNPGFSQEQQISLFYEIDVKPGTNYEFEKYIKEEIIPALKKSGTQELTTWKNAVFGSGGNYVLSTSIKNFAQLDEPSPLVKAVGPYGAQAMFAKMKEFAKSIRIFTMESVPDLEIAPAEGYVPKLGFQVKATVMPDRNKEYVENTRVITGILKKTNARGFYAGKVGVGGNPNQYYFLVLLDSFADIDSFGKSFGKAVSETKMPSNAGIVADMEYSTFFRDPELCIEPEAQ